VIVQAPAPARPIEKSFAGASLLALVLSWKYAFHLPLYRQCHHHRREENRDEQDDLDNGRPKKTDEEDHGVDTAGITRKSDRS